MTRLLTALAALLVAPSALATIIAGGNIINQTWTPAGSPYIVQGDITIPAGASLTIHPAVAVQFASTASQASGFDPSRVEVMVRGTLTANGTLVAPITFEAQVPGTAVWYGIIADTGAASCAISNASIRHA